MVRNSAFVFIKPHAVTDKVKELVKETFEKSEISIKKEGSLDAASIDKHKKIDNHYYAIASKATILTPDKLTIPKDKFKEKFELEWDEVLKDGKALNAMQACEKFEVDASKLDSMWADCKKAGDMVKFGGGFYCGKLTVEGKGTYFVFNGFFMSMRSKFVEEGASIYWYFVEWESEKLPWADFRAKLLGPTDPATAPADSLRGMILAKWQDLGLKSEPNTGDNGVHASASPFEALAERINWLGYRVERDPFGKLLIRAGISAGMVKDWSKDPQVTFGVSPIGIKKSLFDTLEDLDSDWCVAYCQMISLSSDSKPKKPSADEMTKLKEKLKALEPLEKAVLAIQGHVPPPPMKYGSKGDSKKGSKREEEEKPPLRQRKGGGGSGGSGGGSYSGGYSSGGKGGGGGGKSSGKSGGKSGGKGGGGGGSGGGKGKGSRKGNKY